VDDRERELDPRVVIGWRVSTALRLGLLLGGVVFAAWTFAPDFATPITVLAGLLWAGSVAWHPRARLRRWRWRLTDIAIELRRGVIVHRHEAVPYFRIQQIDIEAGPIDRLLGITSLSVTSASAAGSATLPGIPAEIAPEVRQELLRRAEAALGDIDAEARDGV
jgi:membrane protein YdbS with pleckstrin-like domain